MRHAPPLLALLLPVLAPGPAPAGAPEVLAAELRQEADGRWRLDVTVAHADTGWEHYADGWRVFGPGGVELGYRELLHPHVEEQPFTRSLGGIVLPGDVTGILVQAEDKVHGPGPAFRVAVPGR